jgi:PHP family Zn ribbon phosphoesterase
MVVLGDFHIHSKFSDGTLSIPELVDLYGQRGFGAIAITDHLCEEKTFLGRSARVLARTLTRETFPHYIAQIKEEAARAWKQYRMVVLPGFEITKNSIFNHRSAHVLAVGLDQYVSADQDILSATREIRRLGGLAIAAHPVDTGLREPQTFYLWNRRKEWAHEFDAWEVASGTKMFQEVLSSGLPLIASSDLHHPKQISSWKTKLHAEKHPEAILAAIREQKLDFVYYQDPCAESAMSVPRPTFCAG